MSEPVKIYESKSANKTWRNSSDLECISLGQDILTNLSDSKDPDSEIQSFIEKKLWKDSNGNATSACYSITELLQFFYLRFGRTE